MLAIYGEFAASWGATYGKNKKKPRVPIMIGKAIRSPRSNAPCFSVKPVFGSTIALWTSTEFDAEGGAGVDDDDDDDDDEVCDEVGAEASSAFREAAGAIASSLSLCSAASVREFSIFRFL